MIDRRTFLVGAAGAALAPRRIQASPPRTLAQAMRGPVIKRGQPGFVAAAHVYNERYDHVLPQAVARPLNSSDIVNAVRFLVGQGTRLRVRSGGHSYAGYSTCSNGVVLDLRHLRRIDVDLRAGTATIGAGAQLIDVYAALNKKGVTIPAGSCPSVGVGGHVLGGGVGLAGRAFGLACDNLISARAVTAEGALRDIDSHSNPQLLWGLRGGGGGNFGVVTQVTMRVHPVPPAASWFVVTWPWSSASAALAAWLAWAPHAANGLSSVFHLQTSPTGPGVLAAGQFMGPASALGSLLAPLQAAPGASVASGDQDYFGLMVRWANCLKQSLQSCHTEGTRTGGTLQPASFDAKSDYLATPLSSAGRAVLVNAIQTRSSQPGSGAILLDSYGGAINQVKPTGTAFVHRNDICCIQYLSYNGGAKWLQQTHAAMRPYVSGMAYQNYIDPSLKNWQHAYYGANYQRLVELQRLLDPHHYFDFPQAIGHR